MGVWGVHGCMGVYKGGVCVWVCTRVGCVCKDTINYALLSGRDHYPNVILKHGILGKH